MRPVIRTCSLTLIVALVFALSACGSSSSSTVAGQPTTTTGTKHCGFLKKAGIVARMGIAYVAFKRYIYNPYKAGKFRQEASGRKLALVKGVLAGLVALHEAKKAIKKANECGAGARIQALLTGIEGRMQSLRSSAGTASDSTIGSQINGMNNAYQTARSDESGL